MAMADSILIIATLYQLHTWSLFDNAAANKEDEASMTGTLSEGSYLMHASSLPLNIWVAIIELAF